MNATMVRETERKYEAGEVELGEPAELLGLRADAGPEEMRLVAEYFDTEDLRLLRAGVTLRRRSGGSDAGWHLKLPAGPDTRQEVRLPLGKQTRPPAELVALTRVHTRGAPLVSVAELDTRRRRWLLADDEHDVAELVDDQVSARTATISRSWREVEVELAEHGGNQVLDQIEGRLLEVGLRRSASASKLAKLLADQLPEPVAPPAPAPDSAGAAVLGYLSAQVEAMRRYDPLVRRNVPDAVHQMRVAARRMRSALQGFSRILDRDRTGELIGELRWVAAELGQARDTEVTAERFAALLAELPDEAKVGRAESDLAETLRVRGGQAQAVGVAALDSDRYLSVQSLLDALLADPPFTARATRKARRELPASLARSYRRVERAMDHARALPHGPERQEALHEARKSAKRLRYLLEASEPVLGERVARTVRNLKSLQTLLGDFQDTVFARPQLRELADQAREGQFTYGVLYGIELARAERLEVQAGEEWERLRSAGPPG